MSTLKSNPLSLPPLSLFMNPSSCHCDQLYLPTEAASLLSILASLCANAFITPLPTSRDVFTEPC